MKERLREWAVRFWGTFSNRQDETEEELRFHLEMAEQSARQRGGTARDARQAAGGFTQAAEAIHDQRRIGWLGDFARDTRHGVRLLAKSPLFTAAAVISLALGIGANTAIFSLVDAVMLRRMPVRQPDSLVQFIKYREPYGRGNFSYPLYSRFRDQFRSFEGVLARAPFGRAEATFGTDPEVVTAELVSGNYYSLLGISAVAGRTFGEEVDRDRAPVAVISYAFWKRRFGMDPTVAGRTFRMKGTVFTIVGVTPPEFFGVAVGEAPDITFPLTLDAEVRGGGSWLPFEGRGWLQVIGRLGRGHTQAAAQAEAAILFARQVQLELQQAPNEFYRKQILSQRMRLEPAGNGLDTLRERFSEPLQILMGIVALVLLIACANLGNLLLGRASARRAEIGVRLAIGAGRGRVIRQLLAEGLILAVAGGALGVLLACWSANALVTVMSNGGARIALNIHPDVRMLAFAAAVSTVACLLFSLVPAMQASRPGIQPFLAGARHGMRWRLGRGLIAAQVAISVVLLIAAGLFGRTLLRLYSLETGFDDGDVMVFSVNSDHAALRGPELRTRILQDLRAVPGIAAASFGMSPIGPSGWDGSIRVEGYTPGQNESDIALLNGIADGYFQTLRTPVVAGREFEPGDTEFSPKVAVVNETFAKRYFAGSSPLGKWAAIAGDTDRREIVGVVKDVTLRSMRRDAGPGTAAMYVALGQRRDPGWGAYIVRGSVNAAVIESVLKRIDSKLRADDVRTLDEDLSRGILRERIMGTLSGFFGILSLLLVAVGIYGVMAFQVARRKKEIGIRIALGAQPLQVIAMVVLETAVPVGAGVAAGFAGAMALSGVAEKMLIGVKPTDPFTFAAACGLLVVLALTAAYLPGRAAARMNPVETLRCE
jgi:predicted permease